MEILKPSFISFSVILIIGALTMMTDLKKRKIYNEHLILGAFLGIAATIFAAVWACENILFHLINGLIAFAIGYCFHRFDLWRGGDAKLFVLYAFLMPVLSPGHVLFFSVFNLFACSFIAGAIILIPVFIKDILINHRSIAKNLFLPSKRQTLFQRVVRIIFFSWILFPCYYLARVNNSVIILTVTYIIFSLDYDIDRAHYGTFSKLEIEQVGPHGTKILNDLIKNRIVKDISDTHVRLSSELDQKEVLLRKIAEGDFDKIWAILQHSNYMIDFLKQNCILALTGFVWGYFMRLWLSPGSLAYPALTHYFILIALSSVLSFCIYTTINHFKDYHERVPFAPLLFIGCILCYTPFITWIMHLTQR